MKTRFGAAFGLLTLVLGAVGCGDPTEADCTAFTGPIQTKLTAESKARIAAVNDLSKATEELVESKRAEESARRNGNDNVAMANTYASVVSFLIRQEIAHGGHGKPNHMIFCIDTTEQGAGVKTSIVEKQEDCPTVVGSSDAPGERYAYTFDISYDGQSRASVEHGFTTSY